jgi:apolipoprotein D and lipocalin family protein
MVGGVPRNHRRISTLQDAAVFLSPLPRSPCIAHQRAATDEISPTVNPADRGRAARRLRFHTWFGPLIPVPREGNYWVLYIDKGYQHALIGTPDRRYLWILARSPRVAEAKFQELVTKARSLGFDVSLLIRDPIR